MGREGAMKKQENPLGVAFILLLFIVLLAACSGTMKGMVQQGGESVDFQFEDSGIGTGTLRTTLSDGETFKGKYADESSSGFVTGFDTEGTGATIVHGEAFETIESYSGNIDAVLFGNKGHTMKCKFQAANSLIGLPSGGEGRCQISDGRVIDVQF
jgi:predicted small secreted protein